MGRQMKREGARASGCEEMRCRLQGGAEGQVGTAGIIGALAPEQEEGWREKKRPTTAVATAREAMFLLPETKKS
jgi:hypothetical protein